LHLAVVIGLYALGRHLLSHRRHGNRIAAWGAAIYAVHPATVTTVAWIGGRSELLAAAFGIWCLVLFTRLQATTKSRHGHVRRWLLGIGLTGLAAMLSQETAYLLPLLGLLIAGYESKERGRSSLFGIAPLRWTGIGVMTGMLALVLAYRMLVIGGVEFSGSYAGSSWFDNLGTALRHFWFLVDHALLPGEPVISDAWRITQAWGVVEVAALLILIPLLAATLIGLKLGHPVAFGSAWFMLWLLPGVGIFPSEHYHDSRTLYLAVWGPAFALAYVIFVLWRPIGRQLVKGAEAFVYMPLIIVLGVISGFSNARWWDHDRLFQGEVASDPQYKEGRVELARAALERGEADVAMRHALAALESSQDKTFTGYWPPGETFTILASAQAALNQCTEAVDNFTTALEHLPANAELHHRRGLCLLELERDDEAIEDFRRALALKPGFSEARLDLGVALADREAYVEAFPLLRELLSGDAGNASRHRALALVMIDARELEDAAQQLELSLADEEQADERARLAWVEWRLGNATVAREHINMALQMDEESSDYVLWVHRQLNAPAGGAGSAD
jgi:tetratricopeptide (TPR) repeat protein